MLGMLWKIWYESSTFNHELGYEDNKQDQRKVVRVTNKDQRRAKKNNCFHASSVSEVCLRRFITVPEGIHDLG